MSEDKLWSTVYGTVGEKYSGRGDSGDPGAGARRFLAVREAYAFAMSTSRPAEEGVG